MTHQLLLMLAAIAVLAFTYAPIILANPTQRKELQAFVEAQGVPFDPNASHRFRSYWDIENIAAAAGSTTDFFNTAASSLQAHGRGIYGCNLPERGKLPGNTELLVTEIRVELLECLVAAKVVDAQKFNAYGAMLEARVGDAVVLDERPFSELAFKTGYAVLSMGEGSAAGVVNGVSPYGRDALRLSIESRFVWSVNNLCYVRIGQNCPADPSAAMSCKVSLYGLEITH